MKINKFFHKSLQQLKKIQMNKQDGKETLIVLSKTDKIALIEKGLEKGIQATIKQLQNQNKGVNKLMQQFHGQHHESQSRQIESIWEIQEKAEGLIEKVGKVRRVFSQLKEKKNFYKRIYVNNRIKLYNIKKYLQTLMTIRELKKNLSQVKNEKELEYYRQKLMLSPFHFGQSLIEKNLIQLVEKNLERSLSLNFKKKRNVNMIIDYYMFYNQSTTLSYLCRKYVLLKQHIFFQEPNYIDMQCQQIIEGYVRSKAHYISSTEYLKSCSILQCSVKSANFLSLLHDQVRANILKRIEQYCQFTQSSLQIDENWMKCLIRRVEDCSWIQNIVIKEISQFLIAITLKAILQPMICDKIESLNESNIKYIMIRFFSLYPLLYEKLYHKTLETKKKLSFKNVTKDRIAEFQRIKRQKKLVQNSNDNFGGFVIYLGQKLELRKEVKDLWVNLVVEEIKSEKQLKEITFLNEEIEEKYKKYRELCIRLIQIRAAKTIEFEKGYSELMYLTFKISDFAKLEKVATKLKIYKEWTQLCNNTYNICFQ